MSASSSRPSSAQPTSEESRGPTEIPMEQSGDSKESLQRYLNEFIQLASAADDVSAVYGMRPIWASMSVSRLTQSAIKIFQKLPVTRDLSGAYFHYVGMLTHESTHLYLSKKENPHCSAEVGNLEKAVYKLNEEVTRLMATTRLKSIALEVLTWGCGLCSEICKRNYERPIARKAGSAAPAATLILLPFFESCPTVANVIHLIDQAIAFLLESAHDECLSAILDASRQGFYFDWLFLHIASSFPGAVVPHLLKVGCEEFKQYVLAVGTREYPISQTVEVHETFNQRFQSVSTVFTFLCSKCSADLRSSAREMLCKGIERLEDASEDGLLTNDSDLSVAFLFKLIANSPDLLRFLAQHTYDLVTSSVIINVAKQLSQVNLQCILPAIPAIESYTSFFRQMIFYINAEAVAHLFELALPFAYDERVFEQLSRKNRPLCEVMKEGAIELVDEIVDAMLSSLHNQRLFNLADFGLLKRIACDTDKLNDCVTGLLSADNRSKFFIRYLHAYCLATGPVKTQEIIVRFIMEANGEQQLACFCAFLVSVISFFPTAASDAIRDFYAIRRTIEAERKRRKKFHDSISEVSKNDFSLDSKWIENLRMLNEWEKTVDDKNPIKYISFAMTSHYGSLMCDVLRWCLDEISRIDEAVEKGEITDDESVRASLIESFSELSRSISPAPVLSPKYAYKLAALYASLLTSLLRFVGQEDHPISYSIYMMICTSAIDFLTSQVAYVKEQFIIHIIDETLAQSNKLFGCLSYNVWQTEMSYASGCAKEDILEDFSLSITDGCESIFEQARKLPLNSQKIVEMAHSGLIGKGAKRNQNIELKASEWTRRLAFFDSIQRFCSIDSFLQPQRLVYKQMAMTITNRFCNDGLTNSYLWDDWEIERENTPRYIAVAKAVNDTPFIWDLMFAIAEVQNCLWFCSPLLKAIFASVLIQFENSSDQFASPPKNLVELLDKWFLLAKNGQILPIEMSKFFYVIPEVNCHECFVILLDVWKYFQSILGIEPSPLDMLNSKFDLSQNGTAEPIKGDVGRYKTCCRLVIQNNISKLGFLFPVIFAEHFS